MNRSSEDRAVARELQERQYAELRRAASDGNLLVYGLTHPQFSPCTLLESHTENGTWHSITLGYGPWDEDQEHVRITTSRHLPDRTNTAPVPVGLEPARPEPIDVDVDGTTVPGLLLRRAETWTLSVEVGGYEIAVSGRGQAGNLALHQITDLTAPVEARRSYLEARLRERGTQQD